MSSRPFLFHTKDQDNMLLRCSFDKKEIAKSVYGARWDSKAKAWSYPVQVEVFNELHSLFCDLEVEPALKRMIDEMARTRKMVAQQKTDGWEKVKPVEPIPLKTNPFQHQILGYNLGLQLPNIALLMEQGTGKTLTAIAIAGRRFLRGEIKRLLICAPASVVPVWSKEFGIHANFNNMVYVLEGDIKKRASVLNNMESPTEAYLQVAVINYEATWRMINDLLTWNPDMIICDESQRIKTPGSKQSKALHQLGRVTRYRMILTGTPVTQSPLDFFSQYKFLDPMVFGNSFLAFRNRYAIMGGYGGYQIIGYKNLPELVRKAHNIAYRVTKEEALDLPETIDQEVYCELEQPAMKIYKEIAKESVARLKNDKIITTQNVLAKLTRLCQIAGGFVGDNDGNIQQVSSAKLGLLHEVLEDLIGAGKKAVIFARYIPEIEAIEKLLSKNNWGYAKITGETPMKKRGDEVSRFQTDKEVMVFLTQLQAGGAGITLNAADTCIFYSLDFSYANYEQCKARIHRIGQRNACTYIHMIAKGTADSKILDALKKKKSIADEVVDNWAHYFE